MFVFSIFTIFFFLRRMFQIMKRFISILLCLLMVLPLLVACQDTTDKTTPAEEEEEEDKGAEIKMYLSDIVYDLDPAYSLNNKSAQKLVSLLFAPPVLSRCKR